MHGSARCPPSPSKEVGFFIDLELPGTWFLYYLVGFFVLFLCVLLFFFVWWVARSHCLFLLFIYLFIFIPYIVVPSVWERLHEVVTMILAYISIHAYISVHTYTYRYLHTYIHVEKCDYHDHRQFYTCLLGNKDHCWLDWGVGKKAAPLSCDYKHYDIIYWYLGIISLQQ